MLTLLAGRPRELERLLVVVDEDLRVVGERAPRPPLDPVGGRRVLLGRGARGICWYATSRTSTCQNENSSSSSHRRDAGRTHELPPHELAQARQHVARARDRRAPRERPSRSSFRRRSVLEQRLRVRAERVQPRRDQRLHGLGTASVLAVSALDVHAHELLRVERVAARPLEQRRLRLRRQHGPLEQSRTSRAVSLRGQRREPDRRRVPPPSAPARRGDRRARAAPSRRRAAGTGAPQSRRCSRKSSNAVSAQCRSSSTSTSGRRAASASRYRLHAENASSRPTAAASPPAPASGASRDANHPRSDSSSNALDTVCASFAAASR